MHELLNWILQGVVVAGVTSFALRLSREPDADFRCKIWWAALVVVLVLPVRSLFPASANPDVFAGIAGDIVIEVPAIEQRFLTAGSNVLFTFLILWTAFHAARCTRAVTVLARIRNASVIFPSDREVRLRNWMRVKGNGRQARLALSGGVHAASVLGVRDPMIAVAPALLDRLQNHELDSIVVHEWAHVQRRDDCGNLVQLIIRAACGWHPAVWWIDRQICLEREAACDGIAVRETGSAKAYAACLIKLASVGLQRAPLAAPAALASSDVGIRVIRILQGRHNMGSSRAAPAVVALFIGAAALAGRVDVIPAFVAGSSIDFVPLTQTLVLDSKTPPIVAPQSSSTEATAVRGPRAFTAEPISLTRAPAAVADSSAPRAEPYPPPLQLSNGVPALRGAMLPELPSMPSPGVRVPADSSEHAVAPRANTPWKAAVEAGEAIGRGSRRAGVSTAGFFNRLGRRIAGSF